MFVLTPLVLLYLYVHVQYIHYMYYQQCLLYDSNGKCSFSQLYDPWVFCDCVPVFSSIFLIVPVKATYNYVCFTFMTTCDSTDMINVGVCFSSQKSEASTLIAGVRHKTEEKIDEAVRWVWTVCICSNHKVSKNWFFDVLPYEYSKQGCPTYEYNRTIMIVVMVTLRLYL